MNTDSLEGSGGAADPVVVDKTILMILARPLGLSASGVGVQSTSEWTADRRLTAGPGEPGLSFNFARTIAADQEGAVHLVWFDSEAGPPRPPDLLMKYQREIGLSESQRKTMLEAIAKSQTRFVELQWDSQGETEKLAQLLQARPLDEAAVLAQADRLMALERDVKREPTSRGSFASRTCSARASSASSRTCGPADARRIPAGKGTGERSRVCASIAGGRPGGREVGGRVGIHD